MARAFGGALLLLGVGGVVIAAVEIALFWPLEGRVWLYSLFSWAGLVYLAAGPAAWWRRPSNPSVPLRATPTQEDGQSDVALTPGRSPNRAFASNVRMMRSVCRACAAMIKSCAPRGLPVRRACAMRRAWQV